MIHVWLIRYCYQPCCHLYSKRFNSLNIEETGLQISERRYVIYLNEEKFITVRGGVIHENDFVY